MKNVSYVVSLLGYLSFMTCAISMEPEGLTYNDIGVFEERISSAEDYGLYRLARKELQNSGSDDESIRWGLRVLDMLCKKGYAPAQVMRANIAESVGDFYRAEFLYHQAAAGGHPDAQLKLLEKMLQGASAKRQIGQNEFFQHFSATKLLETFQTMRAYSSIYNVAPEVAHRIGSLYGTSLPKPLRELVVMPARDAAVDSAEPKSISPQINTPSQLGRRKKTSVWQQVSRQTNQRDVVKEFEKLFNPLKNHLMLSEVKEIFSFGAYQVLKDAAHENMRANYVLGVFWFSVSGKLSAEDLRLLNGDYTFSHSSRDIITWCKQEAKRRLLMAVHEEPEALTCLGAMIESRSIAFDAPLADAVVDLALNSEKQKENACSFIEKVAGIDNKGAASLEALCCLIKLSASSGDDEKVATALGRIVNVLSADTYERFERSGAYDALQLYLEKVKKPELTTQLARAQYACGRLEEACMLLAEIKGTYKPAWWLEIKILLESKVAEHGASACGQLTEHIKEVAQSFAGGSGTGETHTIFHVLELLKEKAQTNAAVACLLINMFACGFIYQQAYRDLLSMMDNDQRGVEPDYIDLLITNISYVPACEKSFVAFLKERACIDSSQSGDLDALSGLIKLAAFTRNNSLLKLSLEKLLSCKISDACGNFTTSPARAAVDHFLSTHWHADSAFIFAQVLRKAGDKEVGKLLKKTAESLPVAAWYRLSIRGNTTEEIAQLLEEVPAHLQKWPKNTHPELGAYRDEVFKKLENLASDHAHVAYFLANMYGGYASELQVDQARAQEFFDKAIELKHPEAVLDEIKKLLIVKKGNKLVADRDVEKAARLIKDLLGLQNEDIQHRLFALITLGFLGNLPLSIKAYYELASTIIAHNKDIGFMLVAKAEEKLREDGAKASIKDRLLLKTTGLYELFKEEAAQDAEYALSLAVILARRANDGVSLERTLEASYQKALALIEYAQEKDVSQNHGDTLKMVKRALAFHYVEVEKNEQAAEILKFLMDSGDYYAQASYAELLGTKKIERPDAVEYCKELLRDVLQQKDLEERVYNLAVKRLYNILSAELDEKKGTPAMVAVREEYISLLENWYGQEGKERADKIRSSSDYYLPQELQQRFQEKSQEGDPQALLYMGRAWLAQKDVDRAQADFERSIQGGSLEANLELARLCVLNDKKDSFEKAFSYISRLMESALASKEDCLRYDELIDGTIQFLHELDERNLLARWYLAKFEFQRFLLIDNMIVLENARNALYTTLEEFAELLHAKKQDNIDQAEEIKDQMRSLWQLDVMPLAEKIASLHAVSELEFDLARCHILLGEVEVPYLSSHLEHLKKAIDLLNKLKNNSSAQHLQDGICREMAKAYYYSGAAAENVIDAEKCLNKAITIMPQDAEVLFERGKIRLECTVNLGLNIKKTVAAGIEDIKKAAQLGLKKAKLYLADFYMHDHAFGSFTVKKNREYAKNILHELADQGEIEAQIKLGTWYYEEGYFPPDYHQAEKYLTLACATGSSEAEFTFAGYHYFRAIKSPENSREIYFKKAYEKFQELLESDHKRFAHLYLAKMYLCAFGVEKSLDRALDHFEKFLDGLEGTLQIAQPSIQFLTIINDLQAHKEENRVRYLLGVYWSYYALHVNDEEAYVNQAIELLESTESVFENNTYKLNILIQLAKMYLFKGEELFLLGKQAQQMYKIDAKSCFNKSVALLMKAYQLDRQYEITQDDSVREAMIWVGDHLDKLKAKLPSLSEYMLKADVPSWGKYLLTLKAILFRTFDAVHQ